MKKNKLTTKEILGFDPTQLDIYDNNWCSENKVFECNDRYNKYFKSFIDKYFIECLNIVLPYKYHKKVYLAGKITPNGWRQSIFDMRNNFFDFEFSNRADMVNTEFKYNENIIITGPWFLSCDHSCYHGERNHGVGIHSNCSGADHGPFTGEEVTEICRYQINAADILFAYINDDTCYGTLAEIGYAKGRGKKIVTIFFFFSRKKNMWFISKLSDFSTSIETEWMNDVEL